ncbi:MAG: DNA polymerase III subunit gamma/tau [Bacteroidetes bacterium]|nr:DNA polymerase III subunit gamma/tau [Bacteroidota bacterium]
MEDFVVSARKYRPQLFNTVVGQSHITNTLKNAITTGHLAQAYLFCGPRGVGKTTCARIFAKTINCPNTTSHGEACDKCESCLSFNTGASLNVYELDAASNNSVEDIRNLVDQVRFAPQLGKYKVYIIDEVHMLSTAAFNAFLKTLEEPPPHAKFILATTEKHKIIPTILSRCQVFNFNRIKTEDISNHLAYMANNEGVTFEPEALHVIAQKADGGLRDACSIFDQMVAFTGKHLTYTQIVENLHVLDYDYYFKIVDYFIENNVSQVMLTFNDVLNKGFDGHNFLIGLGEHLRNLMVSKDLQTIQLIEVSDNLKKKFEIQSQACTLQFLLKALALISKTDVNYKSAKNQRLLVEMCLMQLTFLTASTAEAEKKNDQPIGNKDISDTNLNKKIINSINALQEPEIKFAKKPTLITENINLTNSFSLNKLASEINTKQNNVFEQTPQSVQIFDNKPLIATNAINAVIECAGNYNSKQVEIALKTSVKNFSNNTITIEAANSSLLQELNAIKHLILGDVRKKVSSNELQIIFIENKSLQTIKAFKPQDIFKQMTEKNPAINDLKIKLGLEIDY